MEIQSPPFQEKVLREGSIKILRTPNDKLFGSYELKSDMHSADSEGLLGGILRDETLYILDPARKTAFKMGLKQNRLASFLEQYLSPFVVLTDRKRAEEKYNMEVEKEDEWYTYLTMIPKKAFRMNEAKGLGWFGFWVKSGRVVVMKKDSADVPRFMPKQFWFSDGATEYTVHIRKWRMNADNGLTPKDFESPEGRRGWEIHEVPIGANK